MTHLKERGVYSILITVTSATKTSTDPHPLFKSQNRCSNTRSGSFRLATSRPPEFLGERSELFRPRRGQGNDELARGHPCAILNRTKDFFESPRDIVLSSFVYY